MANRKKKIILFASGNGSNAENIIRYFQKDKPARVTAVFTNNSQAGVIRRAQKLDVPVYFLSRDDFLHPADLIRRMKVLQPDLIVLAGFLWKIPAEFIVQFPEKIINIHPALLPAYGGKGMYGKYVHEAVLAAGEKKTGITIHYVNAHYDEGQILFQKEIPVLPDDTPETLAGRIHRLEYRYFPRIIESLLES